MRYVLALFAALTLALAACGGGGPSASPTPSGSGTPVVFTREPTGTRTPVLTPTPTPMPTPAPTVPPELQGYRVVFVRGMKEYYLTGELWTAELDGSEPVRVSGEGKRATFAGVVRSASRGTDMYYVPVDSSEARYAAVSPDGREVAYIDVDSLWVFDVQSGEKRLLLQGNQAACDGPGIDPRECHTYRAMSWSPDGLLIAVSKVYYEGGHMVVIDPASGASFDVGRMETESTWAEWSPSGRALCTAGQFAAPSGLYIARPPDWRVLKFYGEYETDNPSPWTVNGCAWADDAHVRVLVSPTEGTGPPEVALLDLNTGTASLLPVKVTPGVSYAFDMVAAPGADAYVVQSYSGTPSRNQAGQPELVDGSRVTPILQTGDWLVEVVAP
jgi:hypothetical protein